MAGIVSGVKTNAAAVAADAPVDWLQQVTSQISMFLHPSRADNVERGAREVLNSLLLKFDDAFQGVVLAYNGVQLLSSSHKILPLYPYFSVRLRAQLLVFAPKAGMIVEGKVNRVEKDYIGMLVLGLFNVAVGSADMREDLYYDGTISDDGGAWLSEKDQDHCIRIGSRVAFLVKSVQEEDEFIDITGSLTPANTGALDWLHCGAQPEKQILEQGDQKNKRKRKEEDTAEDGDRTRKKKKQTKVKEEPAPEVKVTPPVETEVRQVQEQGQSSKKKKKNSSKAVEQTQTAAEADNVVQKVNEERVSSKKEAREQEEQSSGKKKKHRSKSRPEVEQAEEQAVTTDTMQTETETQQAEKRHKKKRKRDEQKS